MVEIKDGIVGDEGGLGDIGEGGKVLLEIGISRREAGDHHAVGVAPDRLLQDRSQLGVAVGHIHLLLLPLGAPAVFRQDVYHLPEGEERLVDVDAFLGLPALRLGQPDPLGPSQVHQVDPAVAGRTPVHRFHLDAEN